MLLAGRFMRTNKPAVNFAQLPSMGTQQFLDGLKTQHIKVAGVDLSAL